MPHAWQSAHEIVSYGTVEGGKDNSQLQIVLFISASAT